MSVEKKVVTEVREVEVEVEKVVLTLNMEQASYLSALLGRVSHISNKEAGMYTVYDDLDEVVRGSGFVYKVGTVSYGSTTITVERRT